MNCQIQKNSTRHTILPQLSRYIHYFNFVFQVTSGFDVCNGMFYNSNGDYGYFATQTFPYITGCFGPGNYPSASVNCSTNAPSSYTKSKYAGQAVSTFGNVKFVLVYTITFLMIMGTLVEQ